MTKNGPLPDEMLFALGVQQTRRGGHSIASSFEEPFHINRRSTLHPEWLINCENPRTFRFAACHAMADEIRVREHGSDVKDGSESTPCEHLLRLRRGLLHESP